jgi:putative membrane protein
MMKFSIQARTLLAAVAIPAVVVSAPIRHGRTLSAPPVAQVSNQLQDSVISPREVKMLQSMTDPNILGHMAMADSVEIVMAKMAQNRSKSDGVLQFAKQMLADHTASLDNERAVARRTGLGMQTMTGELNVSHFGTMVDSVSPKVSDIAFDRDYVLAQVQMHQHILMELRTLQTVARNPAVRSHIAATIPVVAEHLKRARALAVSHDYMKRG